MGKKIPLTLMLAAARLIQGRVAMIDGAISSAEDVTGMTLDTLLVGSAALDAAQALAPDTVGARARAWKGRYGFK